MRKYRLTIVCACGLVLGFLSCNLFNPADERHPERYGPESLVAEGKIQMQEHNWEDAISLFDKALAQDSSLSEAWFYKGKCILRLSQVDLTEVWGDINPARPDSTAVPFLYKTPQGRSIDEAISPFYFPFMHGDQRDTAHTLIDSVFIERKRIYDAACKAIEYLERIHYYPEKMDGVITRKQYESDYLVEISIKTVLGMVDLDTNGILDFGTDEQKAFKVLVQDISSLEPDSMKLDSLKKISSNPQDINDRINQTLTSLGRADTSYLNFADELNEGAEKSDQIDPTMAKPLGDMISRLKSILPYYYYKDKIDNDGDFYNTDTIGEDTLTYDDVNNSTIIASSSGRIIRLDPMIWIDWDGDGKIDINPPSDPDALHIGDSAHAANNANLYEFIDTAGADYQRFKYKGSYCYEWIAGDWGVDEEIMDGKDNDSDGLTDEDTRTVADTLDDDEGSSDTIPLIWEDANADFFIDANEIISGSRYVDEEWYDGLDNDGDGMVDEDCGERIVPESRRDALIEKLRSKGLTY